MDNNTRLAIVLSMAVVTMWLFWENSRVEERQQLAALEELARQAVEELEIEDAPPPSFDLAPSHAPLPRADSAPPSGAPGCRASAHKASCRP